MLTADMLVGDDEQYAVAMALMARQLGIPARVVMGFYPGEDDNAARGSLPVTGTMAHVWVEVPFEGAGWVTFDPTPDRDRTPQTTVPKPRRQPGRRCCRRRIPPINMLQDSQDKPGNNEDSDRPGENVLLRVLLTLGVAALIASLLAAPFVLIAWLKSRRRERRRRHAPELADRFSRRLGRTGGRRHRSRHPRARHRAPARGRRALAQTYPEAPLPQVATAVDAGVFGAGRPHAEEAAAAVWDARGRGAGDPARQGSGRGAGCGAFVLAAFVPARRKTAVAVLPSLAKGEAMSVYPYNLTPEGAPTDATGSFPAVAGYTPMTTGRRVAIVLVDGVIGGAVGGLASLDPGGRRRAGGCRSAWASLGDPTLGSLTLWALFARSARLAGLLMKAQYVDVRTGRPPQGRFAVRQVPAAGRPGGLTPGHRCR